MHRNNPFRGQFVIGQRVYCGLYGGKDGIVVAIHGEQSAATCGLIAGVVHIGGSADLDIIWDNGSKSARVPESLVRDSVQWNVSEDIADADEIIDAVKANKAFELRTAAEKEGTAAARRAERDEFRQRFKHLTPADGEGTRNDSKLAAKNIRTELKRQFPGTKFSVRTDYNSVNIRWTDGPAVDKVAAITKRHDSGTFDGMTDCQGWDDSNTFGQVFGEVRYVWNNRDESDGVLELIGRQYCEHYDIELRDMNAQPRGGYDSLWTIARKIFNHYDVPPGHKVIGIEPTEATSGCASDYHQFFRLVTAAISESEAKQAAKSKAEPMWSSKGYYCEESAGWPRCYRKESTAQKALEKLQAAGFHCEIVTRYTRRGEYLIKLVEQPAEQPPAPEPQPTEELEHADFTDWL